MSQLLILIFTGLFNFFPLILLKMGVPEDKIILSFSVFYFVNFLMLFFSRKLFFNNSNNFLLILMISFSTLLILYLLHINVIFILLATAIVFVIKDFINVNFYSKISDISTKENLNSQNIIATSLLIMMLISALFNPVIGSLFDLNLKYGITLTLFMSFFITYILIKNKPNTVIKKTTLNKLTLSRRTHFHCILSFLYNSTSFFCFFFIVPSSIYKIARQFGFDENTFKIMGLILGVSALFSIANFNKIKIESFKLLFINYFLGIFCWVLIALTYYFFENETIKNNYILGFLFIIPFLTVQVSSKLWSAGFIDYLKNIVNNEHKESNQLEAHKQSLSLFMIYKTLGGFYGFFIAFIFSNSLDYSYVVFINSTIAFLYGFFYFSKKYI